MNRSNLMRFCAAMVLAVPLLAQNGLFATRTDYPAPGTFIGTAAIGDFNGDGRPDIAVASLIPSGICLFLADPAKPGGFLPPIMILTPLVPVSSLVASDFDRDGRMDLLATSSNVVFFFRGNGNATFQDPVSSFAGSVSGHYPLLAVDLNGDGVLDLVSGAQGRVLMGNGNGTFGAPIIYASGCGGGLALADFNGDHRTDFVIVCPTGLAFLSGNGDGTFGAPVPIGPVAPYSTVVAGDFDGDGFQDIVAEFTGSSSATFFKGNGSGGFQLGALQAGSTNSISIGAADFNFDGRLDIVTTDGVLPGLGNGTFGPSVGFLPSTADFPWPVPIADLNGDGAPDFVLINAVLPTQMSVFLSGPPTVFLSVSPNSTTVGQPVALSATVASIGTGALYVTGGKIQFYTGTTPVGPPASLVNGKATLNTTSLAQGIHFLRAAYLNSQGSQVAVSSPLTFMMRPNTCAGSLLSQAEINPSGPKILADAANGPRLEALSALACTLVEIALEGGTGK